LPSITLAEQEPGCGPPAPVPILQWEKEFQVLLEIYRRSGATSLLEIGTYHGGTLYHWLQNSHDSKTKIVTVDSYAVGVDNRNQYEDWNTHYCHLVVLEGDTNLPGTANKVEEHGPFDWLFIDAGHYLHEVTADWNLYSPMVRKGGLACLHDILTHPAWPSIEVGQLWEQIKASHDTFEIVADHHAKWGGIGVVLL
jgi:predicted O-methyltransferase YrrM